MVKDAHHTPLQDSHPDASEALTAEDESQFVSDDAMDDSSDQESALDDQSDSSSVGQPDPDPNDLEVKTDDNDPLSSVLPIRTTLPDMRPVVIRWMTEEEISLTYREMEEAGRRGQGFGEQEWRDEAEFREDIVGARCLAVADARSDALIASLVLAVSRFYRGQDCADPYIVVRQDQRCRGVGDFCLGWGVHLAKRAGFLAMYVDTFSTNHAMISILRRSSFGFQEVGCLPMGGRLAGGTMAQTLIFFLDLSSVDVMQPPHPITQP